MTKTAFHFSIMALAIVLVSAPWEALQAGNWSDDAEVASSEFESGKKFLHGRGVDKDSKKALEHFKKAAELGHIEAPGAIGYFYSTGLVVEKDDAKAVERFQKGSEKGSALAKFNLGRLYLDGKGGMSGAETGLALMEEAAKLGLPEAHSSLAEIYFWGLSNDRHKPDYEKAAPHEQAAAADGVVSAINMLGVMKQSGLGVDQDEKAPRIAFAKLR